MKLLKFILIPLSLLYGAILWIRNQFYNWGLFKESEVDIKTIVIGNLALGGTGKTPHIEFLLNIFSETEVAVLSRGYGRNSSETIFAEVHHTAEEIGDEPLQIIRKYPNITLCVQANRLRGITEIKRFRPDIKLIILDDAFQHRKLKAGLNILLTTFQKPFFKDYYLPSGTLRDHKIRARNTDLTIITKTPKDADGAIKNEFAQKLAYLKKPIFFSSLSYGQYQSLGNKSDVKDFEKYFLVTGIANSELFEKKVRTGFNIERHFKFADHHRFSIKNIQSFRDIIGNFAPEKTAFITTEKDAMRLVSFKEKLNELGLNFFYLPIEVEMKNGREEFERLLRNYLNGTRE